MLLVRLSVNSRLLAKFGGIKSYMQLFSWVEARSAGASNPGLVQGQLSQCLGKISQLRDARGGSEPQEGGETLLCIFLQQREESPAGIVSQHCPRVESLPVPEPQFPHLQNNGMMQSPASLEICRSSPSCWDH